MEQIQLKGKMVEETISASDVKGTEVVAPTGTLVGKVTDVRIDPQTFTFQGIVIKKRWYAKSHFIGKAYIKNLAKEGVLLAIEPSTMLIGKRVMTFEGKSLGKIRHVQRQGTTNTIQTIIVKNLLQRIKSIPATNIESIGIDIVLLKKSYNE